MKVCLYVLHSGHGGYIWMWDGYVDYFPLLHDDYFCPDAHKSFLTSMALQKLLFFAKHNTIKASYYKKYMPVFKLE